MKNRRHYVVIENPNKKYDFDKFIVIPDNEEYDPKKYYSSERTLEDAQQLADNRNSRYYISDYAEDEIKDFFNIIPFDKIESAINERLKLNLTYKKSPVTSRDGWRVEFISNEDLCLIDFMLARMLKTCHLENFGSAISVDKETGELYMWLDINWSYTHHSLGSNGCSFVSVMYSVSKGLEILFEEDRRKND